MKVFIIGASGYIGGSVAAGLIAKGHDVLGLVRSPDRADQVRALGIEPLLGDLDSADVLTAGAQQADAVINAASAEHKASVDTLLAALAGSRKTLIQTGGSSIIADLSEGHGNGTIYDEDTPFTPLPGRATRVAIGQQVLEAADQHIRTLVIAPTLIYGHGSGVNPDSIQIPWLIDLAKKHGCARHIGPGENVWANVHIDDLVDLYLLALEKAPAGAFYYAENGENSMREVCQVINEVYGLAGPPQSMTIAEAAEIWGDGAANYTMGSNSRARAKRARAELGWAPHRPSLIDVLRSSAAT
ncbi:MAG: NAD-dependent epimerase/dehydratase family protein [Rhodospirillales bacterium]|nr:NAD-dependent epimerase/dehydratase family protein [Rhodospirillales bacterium]